MNSTGMPTAEDLISWRLFADLERGHLETLASLAQHEHVPAGTLLFQEGEPAEEVRIIATGRVTLSIRVPGRPAAVVSTLSKGQLLGFSALLPNSSWSASARSLKPCTMILLPAAPLRSLCAAEYAIGYYLMRNALRSAGNRLRDARFQLLDIFGQSSEEAP